MNRNTFYATSEDTRVWMHTERDCAVDEAVQALDKPVKVGDKITVYVGTLRPVKASDLVPDVASHMVGVAQDQFLELGDDWGLPSEFNEAIAGYVDAWCDSHACQPQFGSITDIQPVTVEITGVDADGGYSHE